MSNTTTGTSKYFNTRHVEECILLIDAEAHDSSRILEHLGPAQDHSFQVEWVNHLSAGIDRLRRGGVGAVLLDLSLPETDGLHALDEILQAAPTIPVLVLADTHTEQLARLAVHHGAQDYFIKNHADGYRLRLAVRSMMERQTVDAILSENEVANATLDSIGEAVLRVDIHFNVTYLNRVAEEMTGWSREEALGLPVTQVLHVFDTISGAEINIPVEIVHQKDEVSKLASSYKNCILIRRDTLECGIEHTVALTHNQEGTVNGAVIAFHDVTAANAKSLQLTHLAQHDSLTNLPNRVLFNDRLTQALSLAERQGNQLVVMFVDLDHFKKINDSLGHDVGDKLLQSVASRLLTCVRRTDTVCRYGGDEFVILLSQIERAEYATHTARKILRTLSEPHIVNNKSLDINVSIGVSSYPVDGANAETLLNKADTAMYDAKQHGRNNFQFFLPDMQARLVERQSLELGLRYALGRKEFLLHYQPKLNLLTGKISGVEALLRWNHPQRGMIHPPQFIPIAEECGLIISIGRWVLLQACKQARSWIDMGLGIVPMAVNVSAAEFGNKDFVSGVRAVLIATGVAPENLELELTESVLMHDAESTVDTLIALKAMGVKLAIDDFGTGFSSFSYLQRFHVDALKLHQSFVQEVISEQTDAPLLSAMINLGKSLNQRVVAEGIETRSQLTFLQRHGCNEGQGFFFSHPVSPDHAAKLISTSLRDTLIH